MKFEIILTLTVECDDRQEAAGIADGAAHHLLDTFNDDVSISDIDWHVQGEVQ